MKTLILHNIVSSNSVHKIGSYIQEHQPELGEVEVWFCGHTEANRHWTLQEEITFPYYVLENKKLELKGKDLFTYFINPTVWQRLKKYNPDRIIINGWDQSAYQLAFLWGFLHKKHITLWSGSTKYERSWRRILAAPLVWFFVKIARDYIAYGQRAKEYLVSLGASENKISIFINDVNGEYFSQKAKELASQRQEIKTRLGIKTSRAFLYVGQFIERKGVMDLLQAYSAAAHHLKDWSLLLVGYGIEEEKIRSFIKTHNLQDVVLLGKRDQYELPEVYVAADCLVLPSHEEVWGLVVNEALYSGLKVIVSDICGCVPDLVKIGQNGYTYTATNIQSLQLALEKFDGYVKEEASYQEKNRSQKILL
jgi:glycosyltransferase involved in cell wall biosynthesis